MIDTLQIIIAQGSFVSKFLYAFALTGGIATAVAIQRIAHLWTQQHIDTVIARAQAAEKHQDELETSRHRRIVEAQLADHHTAVHRLDENGYAPVARSIVENPQNAAALMAYNLRNSWHRRNRRRESHRYNYAPGQDAAPQLTDSGQHSAPTVAQAQAQGIIQPGKIYIGTDVHNGEHLTVDVAGIRGMGVLGFSGAGKSNFTRLICAQVVASRGALLAIDPHKYSDESVAKSLGPLAAALFMEPAAEDEEIMQVCGYLIREYENRKKLPNCDHLPYVLLIADELNNILGRDNVGSGTAEIIKRIMREGRKLRMGVLLVAQSYSANETGDAGLRKSLTNRVALKCDPEDARLLLGKTPLVNDIDGMGVGHAIVKGMTLGSISHVHTPLCEPSDVLKIAPIVASGRPSNTTSGRTSGRPSSTPSNPVIDGPVDGPVDGRQLEGIDGPVDGLTADGERPTAKQMRIYQLMMNEVTLADIMREVFGLPGNEGGGARKARQEIREAAHLFGMEDSHYG